eukprot:TRINITY_DN2731_c1_g1_i3.p1 TRINITY_DN2731_c1_g1~~TRINITY_DN2731_c1_g1_i3.p1  ORF type:complete len:520 (-),score=74.17 TRINITY_DN2731_c1_g1_i3:133-1692(-)
MILCSHKVGWQITILVLLVQGTQSSYRGLKGTNWRQLLQTDTWYSGIFTDIHPDCQAEVDGGEPEAPPPQCDLENFDPSADCTMPPLASEIFNYTPAPYGRFPYFVSLQQKRQTKGGQTWYRHFCGGAMLSRDMLVTAAHCVFQRGSVDFRDTGDGFGNGVLKDEAIYIALGPYCRHQKGEDRIMATEFFLHPNYTGVEYESDDIALIKVQTPFKQQTSFPNYKEAKNQIWNATSGIVTAMGHGASNKSEKSSVDVFSQAVSPLGLGFLAYSSLEECNIAVKSVNQIFEINPEKMICFKNKAQDTCVGDSGGPVVIANDNYGITPSGDPKKDILVGLTSWGPDTTCDGLGLPGVYNNIATYVDWITSVLELRSEFVQAPPPEVKQPPPEVEPPPPKQPVLSQVIPADDGDEKPQEPPQTEVIQEPKEPPKQEPSPKPTPSPSPQPTPSPSPQNQENLPEICLLKMDKGPCEGDQKRWYYDSDDGNCVDFSYGGCSGNKNNFKTKEKCESQCISSKDSLI